MNNRLVNEGVFLRRVALLEFVGLVFESIALVKLSPGTFVGFLLLGVPLLVAGMVFFAWYVIRVLVGRGAL